MANAIETLRATVAGIESAGLGRDLLSAQYRVLIGYCPFEDDSENTPEDVRTTLRDYVREECYSLGVNWLSVAPDSWVD